MLERNVLQPEIGLTTPRHSPSITQTRVARIAREMLLIGVAAALMITLDHAFAAGVVATKLNTVCTTWVKPTYLIIVGFVVLIRLCIGGVAIVQEDNNGGRIILVAVVGGALAVVLPAALLALVAVGGGFNC
jgi:hypothetical protein